MMHLPRGNALLAALPGATRERVLGQSEPCVLRQGAILQQPGDFSTSVVFPEEGVISVVLPVDRTCLEVGLVGFDGAHGLSSAVTREPSVMRSMVQVPGRGVAIRSEELYRLMEADAALRDVVVRYLETFHLQAAQATACNALHKVEQRLARWILTCHDRVEGDELSITHEFIAQMLGVRRAGVTVATHILEGYGAIRASRSLIRIRDRAVLESHCCSCYGRMRSLERRMQPERARAAGGAGAFQAVAMAPQAAR